MTALCRNNMIKILLLGVIVSLTFTVVADRMQQQAAPQYELQKSIPLRDNTTWTLGEVRLTVVSSAGGRDWATFGVAPNATDGFDTAWDEPEPPTPPFAPCLQAYFPYPGSFVSTRNVSYLQSSDSLTWSLQIYIDILNICNLTNITIMWNASALEAVPSDYDIVLTIGNATVDMREHQEYTFSATTGSYTGSITAWIDTTPPAISQVTAAPNPQMLGGPVNISATVTDEVGVNKVKLTLVYPDSSVENISITQNKTGDTYYCNRTYPQIGEYFYHIWAEDNRGNANTSPLTSFTIIGVQYYLTLSNNGTGFGVIQANPEAPYYYGTNVTLWANASANSTFSRWYGNLNGTTSPQTLTMNGNKTVVAQFTKKGPYTLTLHTNGTGYGAIETSPPGPYYYGDQVTLWANASANSTFTRWYGDLNGTASPQILSMNRNKTVTAQFSIQSADTTPPVTTATLAGTIGNNGWYISNVTVTLTATDLRASYRIDRDDGADPSGVNHTYYKVDSGPWNVYTTPFVVSADGQHLVSYYSDDKAGNIETQKSVSIKIDKTVPTISLSKEKISFNQVKFTAEVSDTTSGIDRVEFFLDGALQYKDTQSPYEWTWTGLGDHTVIATVYDLAGNSQSQSMSTPVDEYQMNNVDQVQMMKQYPSPLLMVYLRSTEFGTNH